ncbi:hypothetical protein LTR08_003232 [Meristemomyces frigidus]|nr:hypothetical protein LTR08_003232 [Meristemomyces frigidus]
MSAVPKFGSFKPKAAITSEKLDDRRDTLSEREQERVDASSSANERPPRHSHHVDGNREHRSKQNSRQAYSGSQRRGVKDVILVEELEESKVFIVDRRGDSKNAEFGSLHRYSIPAYHRTGYGHLVGAPANIKIDRDNSTQKAAVLSLDDRHGDIVNRRPLSGRLRLQQESKLRVIHPSSANDAIDTQSDFVALRPDRGRKRSLSVSNQRALGEIDYRSIDGKAKPSGNPEDEDLEYASDPDLDDVANELELRIRRTNAELVKGTKERPADVDTWLALIEHQAKVIHNNVEAASLTGAEKRSLADVRLSIYERALRYVSQGKPGHERLSLGFLQEGGLVWEHSKLTAKWTEVLRLSPGSVSLWTKYLDFVQTDHSNFAWEKCKAIYIQCLNILHSARSAAATNASDIISVAQVYVFLRLTAFVRDAGYDELAYALWQLVLEMTHFKPADLSDPMAVLEALEDFWESDIPRIGEKNALGWAHQAKHGDTGVRHAVQIQPQPLNVAQSIPSFAQQELDMRNNLHLPATSDDDCTDPFRHVMFSDVRQVLETLVDDLPSRELTGAFLVFMSLPTLPHDSNGCQESVWEADQYLRTEVVDHTASAWSGCSVVTNERQTTTSLFDHAFKAVHNRTNSTVSLGRDLVEFADRVLERLVCASPQDDTLAEYHLAYRLQLLKHEAPKTAKRLLKARPCSLRLYNAYALMEAQRAEQSGKADKVWSMALRMAPSLGEEVKEDVIMLWHSWIATKLQQSHLHNALHLLLAMVDGSLDPSSEGRQDLAVTASQKLKAVRHFENGWERMVYQHKYSHALLFAECHIWFDYLVAGLTLETAVTTCAKYYSRLARLEAPWVEELLRQAQAGLFQNHIDCHRSHKPALVREEAAQSIRHFPQNSVFLDLYAKVQIHFQVEDRIRGSLRSETLRSSDATIISWSYAIVEELRRCSAEASGTTEHSVRSIFARALLEPGSTVTHSLALWTMWLRFEHPQRYDLIQPPKVLTEVQREQALQRAKQVFLDGLRHLPWSKAWVIMGMQAFARDGGMHPKELRQLYDVLAERELRVRVELDEKGDALA